MKLTIQTLSPVHIGTDETLLLGMDFLIKGKKLGFVSNKMVYELLGEERIGEWCAAIERHGFDLAKMLKGYGFDEVFDSVCDRCVDIEASGKPGWLKPQIRTLSSPYIPGSSIKGAIVTAILQSAGGERLKLPKVLSKKNDIVGKVFEKPNDYNRLDSKNSLLRFLRVGDALFDTTMVFSGDGLNIKEKCDVVDNERPMFYECIYADFVPEFDISINTNDYHRAHTKELVYDLPDCMQSVEALLQAVNAHTLGLIERELFFWEEQIDNRDLNEDDLETYLGIMREMKSEAENFKTGGGAVIRIGAGAGWDGITGGWSRAAAQREGRWEDIKNLARPGNDKKYRQYPFPKSRRLVLGAPMGFCKITTPKK